MGAADVPVVGIVSEDTRECGVGGRRESSLLRRMLVYSHVEDRRSRSFALASCAFDTDLLLGLDYVLACLLRAIAGMVMYLSAKHKDASKVRSEECAEAASYPPWTRMVTLRM